MYSAGELAFLNRLREWSTLPGDGYAQWVREDLRALGEDGLRHLYVGGAMEVDELDIWLSRLLELDPE